MIFEARGLVFRYAEAANPTVDGVDLTLAAGELLALVGPNGSGKTTLLRVLLGVLKPERGQVALLERPLQAWDRRQVARAVGVVVQREEAAFPLRVREAAMMGRYAYMGPLGAPSARDVDAVDRALERCDVATLAHRWVSTLSGGEWQRVRIARALAQEPKALVLDEPTANLDVAHEMELFELAARLARADGLAALVVTHHLNLAARYADRLVVLHRGRVAAAGPAAGVIRREVLEPVFGWPVEVTNWQGTPQFIPLKQSEATHDERAN
ncbi:MAG: ABC transporter ATP-binding protein [Gemmatimonadetes bacterium]|nr:ABC transporter ATP-binding protein [Gemmatimonadota bacterium]